jgi:plastocyanin
VASAAAAAALVVAALSGSGGADAAPDYTITAIDYHFHDAHPTRPLSLGTTLRVTNQGRNVHNVRIPAVGYSMDVQPGGEISLVIGDVVGEAGEYALVCTYHEERGMTGTIVVSS